MLNETLNPEPDACYNPNKSKIKITLTLMLNPDPDPCYNPNKYKIRNNTDLDAGH